MSFVLVHWLESDQVGVVGLKSAKNGQKVYPSAKVDFRWGKKYFKAEVLKVSGEYCVCVFCTAVDQLFFFVF